MITSLKYLKLVEATETFHIFLLELEKQTWTFIKYINKHDFRTKQNTLHWLDFLQVKLALLLSLS